MATSEPLKLANGQTLEDVANALIGAESELSGRENLPNLRTRVQPPDVAMPSFQQVLMSNFPDLMRTPGVRPPKTKFGQVLSTIASVITRSDPVLQKETLARKKIENDYKHDAFQTAISLYQAELRRADLMQQQMDDKTKILNQDIADFNERLHEMQKKPTAWNVLTETIKLLTGGEKAAGRAAREGQQDEFRLQGKTFAAIKDLDKLMTVIDNTGLGKLSTLLSGKQPKRELDPMDLDDRTAIAKVITSPGTLARMKAAGADLNQVYDYLVGKFGEEGTETGDGPGLMPSRSEWLRGVNPTPKLKEKEGETISTAPPKLKQEVFDTTDKEPIGDYITRIAKETGDINMAYAYGIVNKYGAATPEEVMEQLSEPSVKATLEDPEVGADVKQIVEYVRQLLTNPKATPNKKKVMSSPSRFHSTKTPPSSNAIQPGNIDISDRPIVTGSGGQKSTVRSMSFERDGKEILIPTVSDDGRLLDTDEAIAEYNRTGKHLGIFKSAADATAYAQRLHEWYESQGDR